MCSENYGFSSSHVWIWEFDCKEDWVVKSWYIRIAVLEKDSWESLRL